MKKLKGVKKNCIISRANNRSFEFAACGGGKRAVKERCYRSAAATEPAKTSGSQNNKELQSLQQRLSTKINELYEMNDKLADLLQT